MIGFVPDWPAPPGVRARITTRTGGVSAAPYADFGQTAGGLNLATHVGDEPAAVAVNRARLAEFLPGPVHWLEQVHGCAVHRARGPACDPLPVADAAFTTDPETVLAVLTADCLPILLADRRGQGIAVVHAGWRGLAGGVIEASLEALRAAIGPSLQASVWMGPAIGPQAFQVGEEVRQIFVDHDPQAAQAFVPDTQPGKWRADLQALARQRLEAIGVVEIFGTPRCTVKHPEQFYSYRRDGRTGRFASLLWLVRG